MQRSRLPCLKLLAVVGSSLLLQPWWSGSRRAYAYAAKACSAAVRAAVASRGACSLTVRRARAQDVVVRLAQAYGYCWGVERAVQMAYEARKQYPGAKLHVTNEIIHNPAVNQVGPAAVRPRCCACCPDTLLLPDCFLLGEPTSLISWSALPCGVIPAAALTLFIGTSKGPVCLAADKG